MRTEEYINFFDFFLLIPYLLVIGVLTLVYSRRKQRIDPTYRFYWRGMLAKIGGTLGFCFIALFYWQEGDTFAYHDSAVPFVKMLWNAPLDFAQAYFGTNSLENYMLFSSSTGLPHSYLFFDSKTFFTIKLVVPFEILGLNRFLLANLVLSYFCFSGFWRLFKLFTSLYPHYDKYFQYSILLFPSTLFFTGGISKDIFTFSAFGWACYGFYQLAIARKLNFRVIVEFSVSLFIIIYIKPYIAIILVPCLLIWWNSKNMNNIKSSVIRFFLYPTLIVVLMGITAVLWISFKSLLQEYADIDKMIEKAYTTQQDLQRVAYQGNSFDIGDFDPSIGGIVSKFPIATASALFRPTLFEAQNMVMYLSGLENLILTLLVIYIIIRRRLSIIRSLNAHPVALFCILFSIFFAFGVGLSTSNFGALVRFRIPLLPLFVSALIILLNDKKRTSVPRFNDDTSLPAVS